MADITALQEQIKQVARARDAAQKLTDERMAKLKAWEDENEIFLEAVKSASEYRNEQENLLRELTLEIYRETGEKKPALGVAVREVTKLDYDPKEAFRWAIQHAMCLKLDDKAFTKVALADTPDFVLIKTEAQATISQDLGAYTA